MLVCLLCLYTYVILYIYMRLRVEEIGVGKKGKCMTLITEGFLSFFFVLKEKRKLIDWTKIITRVEQYPFFFW